MCFQATQGPKVNAVPAGIFVQDNTFKFDNEKELLQAVSFLFLAFLVTELYYDCIDVRSEEPDVCCHQGPML